MNILVFPSAIEASRSFASVAREWDHRVIGASSLENDPFAAYYDAWEHLPYIQSPDFFDRLSSIIACHKISSLYVPHAPSHLHITQLLPLLPGISLRNASPPSREQSRVRNALKASKEDLAMLRCYAPDSSLPASFLASLMETAISLYGECSREKILALCAIFEDAPKGDIVEIGAFFGKSAYVLNRLAHRYGLGSTIAVDPWDMCASVQKDSPQTIQALSREWDWECVFQGFLLAMQSRIAGNFNYIRATSGVAWPLYNSKDYLETEEFGKTPLARAIAVLHIDGNHDIDAVTTDFALWSQALVPGAWLIFDDYDWSQGEGPRKLVERIRSEGRLDITRDFVAGGAAFLKVGTQP